MNILNSISTYLPMILSRFLILLLRFKLVQKKVEKMTNDITYELKQNKAISVPNSKRSKNNTRKFKKGSMEKCSTKKLSEQFRIADLKMDKVIGQATESFPIINTYGLSESKIVEYMKRYLLDREGLKILGYPIIENKEVKIYKISYKKYCFWNKITNHRNIRKFRTITETGEKINITCYDSGQGSESSDSSTDSLQEYLDEEYIKYVDMNGFKLCTRCHRTFSTGAGVLNATDMCVYHTGRLRTVINATSESNYSCCSQNRFAKGCETKRHHYWTGTQDGINGPLAGYRETTHHMNSSPKVYALDCEMCYTADGLDAVKLSVIGFDGRLVYETYINPDCKIFDFNTNYSGVTFNDLILNGSSVKTLNEVQRDLCNFISADTILVGHGLENDLRALKLIHYRCVDTSIIYPHKRIVSLPTRSKLQTLAKTFLNRDIQVGSHDSIEDSRACLEIMLHRINVDCNKSIKHEI